MTEAEDDSEVPTLGCQAKQQKINSLLTTMFISKRRQQVGIWPLVAFALAVEFSHRGLDLAQVQGPLLMTDSEDHSEVPTSSYQQFFDNDIHIGEKVAVK